MVVLNVCRTALGAGRYSWLDEVVRAGGASAAFGIQGDIEGFRESGPFARAVVEALLDGKPAPMAASRARLAMATAGFGGSSGLPVVVVGPEQDTRLRPARSTVAPLGASGRGHAVLSAGRLLGLDQLNLGLDAVVSVEVEIGGAVPLGRPGRPSALDGLDAWLEEVVYETLKVACSAGLPDIDRVRLLGIRHELVTSLRQRPVHRMLAPVARAATCRAMHAALGRPLADDVVADRFGAPDEHVASGLGLRVSGRRIPLPHPLHIWIGRAVSRPRVDHRAGDVIRVALEHSTADLFDALRDESVRYVDTLIRTLPQSARRAIRTHLVIAGAGPGNRLALGFDRPVVGLDVGELFGGEVVATRIDPSLDQKI